MKVKTLYDLTVRQVSAEKMVKGHTADSDYSLVAAKEELRKANEELRVFKYKAHQSVSQNGRSIRR